MALQETVTRARYSMLTKMEEAVMLNTLDKHLEPLSTSSIIMDNVSIIGIDVMGDMALLAGNV